MSKMLVLYGESGTGKSTSLRNLDKKSVCYINVTKKPLPFRGTFTEVYNTHKPSEIINIMKKTDKKIIVIDDFTYVMTYEYIKRLNERGFSKYEDMAKGYFDVIDCGTNLSDDKIVIFISHTEKTEDGSERMMTLGKMLQSKVSVEALFTMVIESIVVDGEHYITVTNNGKNTVKTPMDMFDSDIIDNDLNYVIEKVKEYYGMNDAKSAEELSKIDEEKKAPIELPRKRKRPTLDNGVPF